MFTGDIAEKSEVREKFEKVGMDLVFKRAYVNGISHAYSMVRVVSIIDNLFQRLFLIWCLLISEDCGFA